MITNPNGTPKTPITKEKFLEVCHNIANSSNGLVKTCRAMGISSNSVDEYINVIGVEAELQYARAKSDQLRLIAEQIIDISDTPVDANDSAAVNNKRLQVDSRKWLLSKLVPKIYGDNIIIDDKREQLPTKIEVSFIAQKVYRNTDYEELSTIKQVC